MKKILIIDDERAIRSTLKEILEFEKYEVDDAEDGTVGLKYIESKSYDLIFCDIKMPKMDGIEFLEHKMKSESYCPIIMISGHGNIETAVQALKKGAYDYIEKPLDLNRVLVAVRNALENNSIVEENKTLKRKIKSQNSSTIIGKSKAISSIIEIIDKVAPTDARVLITGANGSGKELVAKQLHEKSNRSKAEFVEVNCAAIPSELIESELFGHMKGAFTSAHKDRKGKFETAHGGTLFLDEIGDMSLPAQAKVLRALQEHKIQRVGSDKDISVDVRVVAATNKNLDEEIKSNRFREDLFHRIAVIEIQVPPLNERRSDIPLLIDHFNASLTPYKSIEYEAVSLLTEIDWSGNVRQLRNVVERLHILSDDQITASDVKQYVNQ